MHDAAGGAWCYGLHGHALTSDGDAHECLQRLAGACAAMRARAIAVGYDRHAPAAQGALAALCRATRRALRAPHRDCPLGADEEACVRAAPGGLALAATCGFVHLLVDVNDDDEQEEEADGSVADAPRSSSGGDPPPAAQPPPAAARPLLVRRGTGTPGAVALLSSIGLALTRALPTPTELAYGPPPRMRAPLLRKPPAFRGMPSQPVELLPEAMLQAERLQLEREVAEAAEGIPGTAEAYELMNPGLVLL